ncbi:MAG: cupin domain-containing protein [Acidobacteria bacterium]|nr:cupin domain-containing protein [Acidobacteriota bacterium]
MKPATLPLTLAALTFAATHAAAQVENMGPKAATYITDADVKKVNALPGVDRQIVSVDIGKLNEAVGIVHRGKLMAPAGGASAAPPVTPPGQAAATPCGLPAPDASAPNNGTGISHDHQTETYLIVSGSGTLVTGGQIAAGRRSAPDSAVTTTLNGPSCSGRIVGDDVVKRVVNVGDIIIIPAGVAHGWAEIPDHVDYLTVRPDPDRVLKPYVHPVLQKK